MLVKYLLNWFTILFFSLQQFPSDVIHLSLILVFLFLDFKTSLIVLHAFLQSFLNIANLFLKYVFLGFYMRQLIFEYFISLLIFYCWITFCIGSFFLCM